MRSKLRPVRAFQAAAPGRACEDAWEWSPAAGCLALCDGAAFSYDAARWARTAARGFAREGGFSPAGLKRRIAEYERASGGAELPWYQQAARGRGSFTTLLTARLSAGGRHLKLTAIGDSLAVLADGGRILDTLPYRRPGEFDAPPFLLSTLSEWNAALGVPGRVLERAWIVHHLAEPMVILLSDAPGRWLLERLEGGDGDPLEPARLATAEGFAEWARAEQAAGRLERDDCTVVVLRRSP